MDSYRIERMPDGRVRVGRPLSDAEIPEAVRAMWDPQYPELVPA